MPSPSEPAPPAAEAFSSAEMTADWRCREPALSLDNASALLATPVGLARARRFDEEVYAGAARHVGIRARAFRESLLQAAATGRHDAVISFGSGFSLQSYYLAAALGPSWPVIDADLAAMAAERGRRLAELRLPAPLDAARTPLRRAIDLEAAARDQRCLAELFPEAARPCVAIEGVVFYLTRPCLRWLFTELARFEDCFVIFDYWPDYASKTSRAYGRLLDFFAMGVAESVQKLIDPAELVELIAPLRLIAEQDLPDLERRLREQGLVDGLLLQDPAELLPCRFVTAERAR